MRQTARISLIIDANKPLNIYLDSHGDPSTVRDVLNKAVRGHRRDVSLNPERIYWRFVYNIIRRTESLYIRPRLYDWRYEFNLISNPPRVHYVKGTLSETLPLFRWLSVPRAKTMPIKPVKPKKSISLKRRGRPSIFSEMQEPLPDELK
jgi:hypothetical protein